MFEPIKFSLTRKLKDPKFRNLILRERICQEVLDFFESQLKINIQNVRDFFDASFDLKTKTLHIYIKDHRVYTNLLIHRLNILNFLKKKFSPDTVRSVSVLKKFH